jgi:DNA-binding NtrC family response regulator
VITITLPPLRARTDDIPLLVQRFLDEFNPENGKQVEGLTPDCMDQLLAYSWPGNIRELRNVIERMVVLSRQNRLTVRDLPAQIRQVMADGARSTQTWSPGLSLEDAEKQMIIRALESHRGNRTKAAQQLGISRRTLHRKLNEYGLRESAEDLIDAEENAP